MPDIRNMDNEDDAIVNFLNQVKDVLGDAPAQGSAIASLTDNTAGTANGTLEDVTATPSQTIINDNFAELNAKVDAILAALRSFGIIAT